MEFLKSNCNNEYEFYYDNSKTFEEQELLDDTKYILFGLFEKFGATKLQKEKIKNFKDNYYRKIEKEKREQYNPEDIFKKANNSTRTTNIEISENNSTTALIEYKKSFFSRLKNFIFKTLHINK